jgi:uncharacterized protein YbaP (TraB family)
MMILRRFALVFVAPVVMALAMGAGPAVAEPSLWAIKDKDSTIYLFGTIHVLKPTTEWRSARIAKAFREADEVVMEIEQPERASDVQALMAKYGVDETTPLSSKLAPQAYDKLRAATQAMGLSPESLESMRPWRAALTVSLTPLLRAGYDPESGVEKLLTAQAKASGKPISAFETLEQQVRFFADMAPAQEVHLLESALDEIDDGPAEIDALVAGWAAGDQTELKRQMVDGMRADYPDVYKLLLVERNKDWARQLQARLAGSGVTFVAVGAGHLAGPDSVQAQLAKLGIKAKPVK